MTPIQTPISSNSPLADGAFVLPGPRIGTSRSEFESPGNNLPPGEIGITGRKNSHREDGGTIIEKENLAPLAPHNARMLRRQATRIFPLHLAPIDAFFMTDDTVRYPMTSVIHVDFTGSMQRVAFEGALSEALERHPLLAAVIRPAKRGELCWVFDPDVHPPVDWAPPGVLLDLPQGERIDLTNACGLRIWVRAGEQATRLTLQVHHASTDGTGVYRFLGDLLALYGRQTCQNGRPPVLENLDPGLLRDRRRRMAKRAVQQAMWPWIRAGLLEGGKVFLRGVQDVAPPSPTWGTARYPEEMLTPFPGIETQELNKDEHLALRDVATAHGAMLNDLLMAEMFRAIASWNDARAHTSHKPWLRIMMPFDLREQSDYTMPAANMTSYTFVDRRTDACSDRIQLLKGVRDETLRLKQDRGGTRFIDALMLAEKWPGILPRMLQLGRCISSVTLSNIGDPTKRFVASFPREGGKLVCGDLVLENISGVPPMRDKMRATCAVFSYQRKLAFCLRCDPYSFRAADTTEFLKSFIDGLRAYL